MHFPTRSPQLVEQIRAAYVAGGLNVRDIAVLFGMQPGEIYALARQHGWPRRSEAPEATPAERAAAIRTADRQRALELYGDERTVDDVRLLRSRGFVVVRTAGGARVGNQLCSLRALRAKAARERRLIEATKSVGRSEPAPVRAQSQERPARRSLQKASCRNSDSLDFSARGRRDAECFQGYR